ncbi:MAG: hypothetical protein ACK5Z1_07890 [Gemmatimonadota bacterium]
MRSPITGPFAPSVVRLGVPLLDWQLWCLGRDIPAPGGNLRGRAGFGRHRPEALGTGSAAYVRDLGRGQRLIAWGFGIFFGDDTEGGVLLRRHGFLPRLAPFADVPMPIWLPEQVAPVRSPRDGSAWQRARRLVAGIAAALASHERFVLEAAGPEHRRQCAAERPRHVRRALSVSPLETAEAWDALAVALRDDVPLSPSALSSAA